MNQIGKRTKRWLSYLLVYVIVISAIQPFELKSALAANRKKLYKAGMTFLQPSDISTEAGIVVSGVGVVVVEDGGYKLVSTGAGAGLPATPGGAGVTTTGSTILPDGSLIASGGAVDVRCGLSAPFAIGENSAPAMFRIYNGGQAGICYQFRVVNSASQGFQAWLVDGKTNELLYQTGNLGGQNVWRLALEKNHTYYLLLSGQAGSTGKLMLSDIMDDHGNSLSKASAISLNKDQSIETEIAGDVDILAFTAAPAASAYQLRIESVLGTGGTYTLCDRNGKAITGCQGTVGTGRVTKAFKATPGARYYIHFSSQQTGRRIVVRVSQSTNYYRVTYHLNGGKNAAGNLTSYTSALSKFQLKNPTRSKYIFNGWYTDAACRYRIYNIYGGACQNYHLYAAWVKVAPQKSSIYFLKSKKIKQVKLKWKKAAGIKGYQVLYGTTRSLKKKVKKKTLKKTYMTLNKLKPGKVYYFKVRTYSLDSKKKRVYSEYSGVKKIKVMSKAMKKKAAKKKAAKKKNKKKKTKNRVGA